MEADSSVNLCSKPHWYEEDGGYAELVGTCNPQELISLFCRKAVEASQSLNSLKSREDQSHLKNVS